MIQVGSKAPDFKVFDTERNELSLENFRGKKLILFFFPMAWTSTCTKQLCALQEDYKSYSELNAVVVGVSVDTIFALKRYATEHHIGFPLLSDFNKEMIHSYDIVHHDFILGYKDVAKRATFVIDEEGIIRFAEVLHSLGSLPDIDAIKKVLSVTKTV